MYKSFAKFILLFRRKGRKNLFLKLPTYGYQGCIRSLEITYSNDTHLYHPHFHCIFVLKKDLFFDPCIVNTEDDVISQEADYEYLRYIEKLWDVEEPKFFVMRLQEIIKDIESDVDLQYISRKTIKGVIENEE